MPVWFPVVDPVRCRSVPARERPAEAHSEKWGAAGQVFGGPGRPAVNWGRQSGLPALSFDRNARGVRRRERPAGREPPERESVPVS